MVAGPVVGVVGLIGLVCAVLLPFAPVDVETPTVSWPLDATAPRSTLLTITAHRPLDLDVRFGCDVSGLPRAQAASCSRPCCPSRPRRRPRASS